MSWRVFCRFLAVTGFSGLPLLAGAYFTLDKTRIIMIEGEPRKPLVVENTNDSPAILCAFVDNGDTNDTCSSSENGAFLLLPKIFKIPPKGKQLTYLVSNQKQRLPADREFLFWLNMTDNVPSLPRKTGNYLQQRIKVFYRPIDLVGLDPLKKLRAMEWKNTSTSNKQTTIMIKNTSPFYASFASIELQTAGKRYQVRREALPMVKPYDSAIIRVPEQATGATIRYELLDDYGQPHSYTATFARD